MKHTLALVLIVLGIVGCASVPEVPELAYLDTKDGLERMDDDKARNLFRKGQYICNPNWRDPMKLDCWGDDEFWNASAINLETDEFYYLMDIPKSLNRKKLMALLLSKCEDTFKSQCIVGKIEPDDYYYSARDYRKKTGNRKLSEIFQDAVIFSADIMMEMAQNSSYVETETSSIEELEKEVEQLRREMVTARIQENLKND